MDLIAGRYEPMPRAGGAVCNPARDAFSDEVVTVLRAPAPADPVSRFRELDRLRRYAAARGPHLAEVRAVELHAGELQVVCGPVLGSPLGGPLPAGLTIAAVRGLSAGLFDAVAALHLTGARGWVQPDAVVVHAPPEGVLVTLLPLPLGGTPPGDDGVADDRSVAATLLLRVLRRVPVADGEDDALARKLTRALERAGGTPEESWGPPGSGLFLPDPALPHPVPLTLTPAALAAGHGAPSAGTSPAPAPDAPGAGPDAPAPGTGAATAPPARAGRRRRSPRALLGSSVAVVAIAAITAVLVLTGAVGRPAHTAAERLTNQPSPSAASQPTGSASPRAWDLPTTAPALIEALSARPDAGGPAEAELLDALRGVGSADPAVVQQSALRVVSLVLDDPRVDPRAGAAALVALATGPVQEGPGAPPSCFADQPAVPDQAVQQYAQRVLDRLPAWQALGLPEEEAGRVRELAAPVAAGQATLVLGACPAG